MDKDQINLLFDRAAGHWNQDFYTDTKKSIKRSWFHFLSDVSYETACHAVDLIAETSRAFPRAIDIRHVVLRMNMSAAEAPPTPAQAWRNLAEVRKRAFSGAHAEIDHHPAFLAAYKEVGRDIALGLSEFRSDREFFLEVYVKHMGLWFASQEIPNGN